MQRRRFACSCLAGMFSLTRLTEVHALTDKAVGANDPPSETQPSSPEPSGRGSKQSGKDFFVGCHLRKMGNGSNAPQFRFYRSTGIPALDAGVTREYFILNQHFTVSPFFFMYDDENGGNAFATPDKLGGHNQSDGTVAFGLRLMRDEFEASSKHGGRFDHAMAAIMAHEWAHILQFRTLGSLPPGKPAELHADQLSGWYMGSRAKQLYGQVDLLTSMRSFFEKGDYAFNHPSHHGTPEERAKAFERGISMSMHTSNVMQVFSASRSNAGL